MSVAVHARERSGEERERLGLADAATTLVDECRMVLPGIQALFGFQLVAVFNQRFADELTGGEQRLHLAAMGLIILAAAIVMTPAAIHRHYGGREVTDSFIHASSLLLLLSMVPLALGLALDFYLISRMILGGSQQVTLLAVGVFLALVFAWMVFPRLRSLHTAMARLHRDGEA